MNSEGPYGDVGLALDPVQVGRDASVAARPSPVTAERRAPADHAHQHGVTLTRGQLQGAARVTLRPVSGVRGAALSGAAVATGMAKKEKTIRNFTTLITFR